jgi:hypothetical protein
MKHFISLGCGWCFFELGSLGRNFNANPAFTGEICILVHPPRRHRLTTSNSAFPTPPPHREQQRHIFLLKAS